MSPVSRTSAALSVVGLLVQLLAADAHLYMMTPVSRNLWGTTAFQEEGSGASINYCPHCFQSRGPAAVRERGGDAPWPHFNGERAENGNYIESDEVAKRHGICGDPEQTAAEGSNLYGLENSNYPVLETYAEGGTLEVRIVVSTYHWGHIEMFMCNTDDLPDGPDSPVTQSCLNKYPLDRAEDDDNQPIDPANRGRFFLDPPCRAGETNQDLLPGAYPGDVATARFKLPDGVTCERCIVQMVYYTGNSCMHQGYAEFDQQSWPSDCAPSKADWINQGLGMCGDGDGYPEEFWNCADIAITSGGAAQPESDDDDDAKPSPAPAEFTEGEEEESDDECAGEWEQCGGTGWGGPTCCVGGIECDDIDEWYHQCRP